MFFVKSLLFIYRMYKHQNIFCNQIIMFKLFLLFVFYFFFVFVSTANISCSCNEILADQITAFHCIVGCNHRVLHRAGGTFFYETFTFLIINDITLILGLTISWFDRTDTTIVSQQTGN